MELLRSQVVSQKSIPRSRMHRTSRKFLAANHELTSDYWNVRTLRNFIARKRCFVTVFPMLKVWVPVPGYTIFTTFQHPKYVKFSDPPIGGSIKYAQFLIFDFAGRQSVRIRNYGSGMSAPLAVFTVGLDCHNHPSESIGQTWPKKHQLTMKMSRRYTIQPVGRLYGQYGS